MGFGDLKSGNGISTLDGFLKERSYIDGYVPSQADSVVYSALSGAPAAKYVNALRWFNHIKSYAKELSALPGIKKPITEYGPAGGAAKPANDDDDDDFDLFDSDDDEEDEKAAEELKAKRIAEYNERKSKKTAIIAKSNLIIDVKPWDDETDMKEMENCVRTIEADGLLWGTSKLVPVGYGIKKLVISAVIEDDKIGTDFLEEEICKFEDLVQSMDVAAFNKI